MPEEKAAPAPVAAAPATSPTAAAVSLENGQTTTAAASTPTKVKRQKTPTRRRPQHEGDVVAGGVGITGGGVVILPQHVLNELYHNYSIKQRRSGLKWYLFAAVLFNIWTICIPWEQALPTRGEWKGCHVYNGIWDFFV